MFTSKSVSLLVAIVVLLAIAWNTDITMVYIFFVISFVLFALTFLHLHFNVPELIISRKLPDTAFEDEMVDVKMELQNKKGLPVYFFEILDKFPGGEPGKEDSSVFVLNMAPREKMTINYALNCYRRGLWRIGPAKVISQDALGFFRMKRTVNVFSDLLVYPALFRVYAFPALASGSVSWMGVETAKISGDSHEFFGVREYQRGDAISRMHWPLTARHNKLIVKQFERNAVQEVTIVLDLKEGHDIGVGKHTTLEYALKISGSVARFLLNNGAFVQMIGYGKEAMVLPFGKGESHVYKILEYLARAQADSSFTLSQTLEEASFLTPYNSTLITVMLDNDMDAVSSLVQFKVKCVKLIVIVLSTSTFGHTERSEYLDEKEAKEFEEALASLEAHVYKVAKGDDLEKKFEIV